MSRNKDPLKFDSGRQKSMDPKQVRARMRRRQQRTDLSKRKKAPTVPEVEALYKKPMDEWDDEELARGRPRAHDGSFRGVRPLYITQAMQEAAFNIFAARLKEGTQATSIVALKVLGDMLQNNDEDDRGKPIIPAGVKADVAKYLIDRVLGKPTQPIKGDLDVRLSGILASVMVDATGEVSSSHRPIDGIHVVDTTLVEDDDEDEDEDL